MTPWPGRFSEWNAWTREEISESGSKSSRYSLCDSSCGEASLPYRSLFAVSLSLLVPITSTLSSLALFAMFPSIFSSIEPGRSSYTAHDLLLPSGILCNTQGSCIPCSGRVHFVGVNRDILMLSQLCQVVVCSPKINNNIIPRLANVCI